MKRESWSIVGACALGAFIGTVAALDISTRFQYGSHLWGIGALLGGVVAYVAVDFRHFCAGVAHSYRKTITWRPYKLYWRTLWSAYVAGFAIMPTILTGFTILLGLLMAGDPHVPEYTVSGVFVYTPLTIAAATILITPFLGTFLGLLECHRGNRTPEKYEEYLISILDGNWGVARVANPAMVAIYIVLCIILGIQYSLWGLHYGFVHSPQAAAAIGSGLVEVGKALGMFIAGVFVYVHSQRRTLCFVDATIGAAIGYSFGSAIVGAIAGAILGVINYELVSVRWLKLALAQTPTT